MNLVRRLQLYLDRTTERTRWIAAIFAGLGFAALFSGFAEGLLLLPFALGSVTFRHPAPPDADRAAEWGTIVWNPPEAMAVGATATVEVRIGDAGVTLDQLVKTLADRNIHVGNRIEVASRMRVRLTAHEKDFKVEEFGDADQLLRPGAVAHWDFGITALRRGRRALRLQASIRLPIGDKEEVVNLPSYTEVVRIVVDPLAAGGGFLQRNWKWILTVLATAAVGIGAVELFYKEARGWLGMPAPEAQNKAADKAQD